MDGIVYLITNTANGKKYVGSTCRTLEERMRDHLRRACKKQHILRHPLYQDFNTYGIQSFKIEPLLTMKFWQTPELWMVEDAYIAIHDSINNGYNKRYNTFHLKKQLVGG
jgi:group I intron endonuclease